MVAGSYHEDQIPRLHFSSFELLCQDTNPSTRLTDNEADR